MSLIIVLHNQGIDDTNISDYNYEVRINERIIESGHIAGHDRAKGWRPLVEMLVDCTNLGMDKEPKSTWKKAEDRNASNNSSDTYGAKLPRRL